MFAESNPKLKKTVNNGFRSMPSAMDRSRESESRNDFGTEAQENFGANERGSEEVIDMMEKGTI